jgi:hypothetical protein
MAGVEEAIAHVPISATDTGIRTLVDNVELQSRIASNLAGNTSVRKIIRISGETADVLGVGGRSRLLGRGGNSLSAPGREVRMLRHRRRSLLGDTSEVPRSNTPRNPVTPRDVREELPARSSAGMYRARGMYGRFRNPSPQPESLPRGSRVVRCAKISNWL